VANHRTIYVDESGDLGFGVGGSKYLVICFVSTPDKNSLLRTIRRKKQKLGVSPHDELKGSTLVWEQREPILRAIASLDLSIHTVIVNKAGVQQHLRSNTNVLYNYALQFPLIAHIKTEHLDSVGLVIDERTRKIIGAGQELDHYLRVKVLAEEGLDVDLRCFHVNSRASLGIQAADLLANAMGRNYERGQARGRNIIAKKIRDEQKLFFP